MRDYARILENTKEYQGILENTILKNMKEYQRIPKNMKNKGKNKRKSVKVENFFSNKLKIK